MRSGYPANSWATSRTLARPGCASRRWSTCTTFLGDSLGRAVPYGVYDLTHNRGLIYLGTSGDTAAFAADAIAGWWKDQGQATWSNRDHFLLLADAGGSNSCRTRAWKERLQVQVCDRFGLTVTV